MIGFGKRSLIGVVVASLWALPLQAAELLMFERAGCVWCARWDREVGVHYARTPEGERAPLRRVDLDTAAGTGAPLARSVRYTPTFVLVADGREVGRITGYPGDAAFWGLLGALLARSQDRTAISHTMEAP